MSDESSRTSLASASDLIKAFMKAYQAADEQALAACVSPDFVWHQHVGPDAPHGQTIEGVAATVDVIRWRQANWRDLRYDDMRIRVSDDLITQSFRVSGVDENGKAFDVRAVDLYPVRDGRIAAKDTYWKQVTG